MQIYHSKLKKQVNFPKSFRFYVVDGEGRPSTAEVPCYATAHVFIALYFALDSAVELRNGGRK